MRILLAALLLLATPAFAESPEAGTTIVGEQEAAVGLYLMPWQDEHASDIDRPPSRLDPAAGTLDAEGYRRRSAMAETLLSYRREQLQRVH